MDEIPENTPISPEENAKLAELTKDFPPGTHFHVLTTYEMGSEKIKGTTPFWVVGFGVNQKTREARVAISFLNPRYHTPQEMWEEGIMLKGEDLKMMGTCPHTSPESVVVCDEDKQSFTNQEPN